jgi:hypothetical protein
MLKSGYLAWYDPKKKSGAGHQRGIKEGSVIGIFYIIPILSIGGQ